MLTQYKCIGFCMTASDETSRMAPRSRSKVDPLEQCEGQADDEDRKRRHTNTSSSAFLFSHTISVLEGSARFTVKTLVCRFANCAFASGSIIALDLCAGFSSIARFASDATCGSSLGTTQVAIATGFG